MKAKVVAASVKGSALYKHNHILSVGRQRWRRPQQNQLGNPELSIMITYKLKE